MKKKNSKPFDPKDPSTWPKSSAKPTEAFTTKGTAAKDLAKSKADNRFSSNAKTKVKGATDAFAGSGTPLGTFIGVNPMSKGQIAGAVGSAVGGAMASKAIVNSAQGLKSFYRANPDAPRPPTRRQMTPKMKLAREEAAKKSAQKKIEQQRWNERVNRPPGNNKILNVPPAPRPYPRPSFTPSPPQPPLNVPKAPGNPAPRPPFATTPPRPPRRPKK